MNRDLRPFFAELVAELTPSVRLPGGRYLIGDPRLLPDAPGAHFANLDACVRAFDNSVEDLDLWLHVARDLCTRIERAVQHWDEFTADRLPYPLRQRREYAAWVRRLAEWRAYAAMYEHTLEHFRAGRTEEALLPYARYAPHAFWDQFWGVAWKGDASAVDWLCAHIVPQLLPQQECACRRALQGVIDNPWHPSEGMDSAAMRTALLATHFTVYPRPSHLGADTRRDMRDATFRDGPWRVFLPR